MQSVVVCSLVVFVSIACLVCGGSEMNSSSVVTLSTLVSARPHIFTQKLSRKRYTATKPRPIRCDLYCCNCNGDRARCTGQDHRRNHYLPQLPANIRDFRMFRAKFYHLNRTMMLSLSNFELTIVNLTDNQIHHIAPDTFADFSRIRVLDLSYNRIPFPELKATLTGMRSLSLSTLALGAMGYSSLPDHFFDTFFNRTFRKVDLQQNQFRTFNSALFWPFWRTNIVNMEQNVITDVNMSVRVNIQDLILKQNRLEEFPDLSLNKSQTRGDEVCQQGFYSLFTLIVSDNPLWRISPRFLRGDCLPRLRRLEISSISLKLLESNFIADLPELKVLVMSKNQIRRYQPYAFNSSSLEGLYLDDNRRFDKDSMDVDDVFKHCPNLKRLRLQNTKVEMDSREMYRFLLPLRSVQTLNLQKIRKGGIPPDLLWRLPNLTKLIFAGNNLNSNGLGKALEKVTHLKSLNVQANSITVVKESTLPWEFRRNLERIDLSQNPFSCTCELLWFRNWVEDVLKNGSVQVKHFYSSSYRCRTPLDKAGIPLHKYRPTAASCALQDPVVVMGVVGGCFLLGLLLLLSLVYRYRWYLRYYVYRLRRRRQYGQIAGGLVREDGNSVQMYPYDAYLAHSPQDVDWVVTSLLPIVEGQHGLRVFLEERDSVPGSLLVHNITRYMDESARVMLIISDHYNREGWRQCEFEHILYAAFEQHKDVIVLLLGDVEAGRMTRDMRRMLTRGTFLQWGDSPEAQTAFCNGLKVALKTQDVSFQSLC